MKELSRVLLLTLAGLFLGAPPARAFPPYRLTDAGVADLRTFEVRLGLVKLERDRSETSYSSPLLRVNYGLARDLELLSEFEYAPEEGQLSDGALGVKWIPAQGSLSLGAELLALLPVSGGGGSGIEASFLATLKTSHYRLHLNAGGFRDTRSEKSDTGWKGGVLAELLTNKIIRPGFELFASRVRNGSLKLLAGPGVIVDLGPVDLRAGVTAGLTEAAPSLGANLWITTNLPLRRRG